MSGSRDRRRRAERRVYIRELAALGVPESWVPCPHCGRDRMLAPLAIFEEEMRGTVLEPGLRSMRTWVRQDELIGFCGPCGCLAMVKGPTEAEGHAHDRPAGSVPPPHSSRPTR